MASKTPHERVRALLSKTRANGATEGEETSSVDKALQLIVRDELPIGDFIFPAGYGRDGLRTPVEPEVPRRPRIIKQACESLLMEITGRDKDGFTTGHSYEEILRRVKLEFPAGNTSIKCLRWYCTHMKEQGCRMPQKRDRPAPKPRQPRPVDDA
jgi:hypothetical protein